MNAEGTKNYTVRRYNDGLQWSRVRMNAEGGYPLPDPSNLAGASMEPRSDERGRIVGAAKAAPATG